MAKKEKIITQSINDNSMPNVFIIAP
jgi:hypothetical protein